MDHLDFSEEEIQQQLAALGYNNIPKQRLQEFKRDLDDLVRHEKSKSHSSSEWSSPPDSRTGKSPPALVKEKVHLNSIGPSRNYALVHASSVGQHHDIFTSTFNEEDIRDLDVIHYYDSYSRHSIAHRPARPSTAPTRLETEERPSEIFYSVSDASHTTSPERENWAQKRPMIKRKVLRKYQGQPHVCDESTHSEDSAICFGFEVHFLTSRMYKGFDSHLENENEDDGSLSSSFWTDQESEEEREWLTKGDKTIVRELEKDSKTEKEHFVMASGNTEKMKETLKENMLETDNYMQVGTNPKADDNESKEEREIFIDEDEKDKSTEKTRTETEEESEDEHKEDGEEEVEDEESGEDTETESEKEIKESKESDEEMENKSEHEEEESEEEDTETENKERKESDEEMENRSEYEEEDTETENKKSKESYEEMENKSEYEEDKSEEEDTETESEEENEEAQERKSEEEESEEDKSEYEVEDEGSEERNEEEDTETESIEENKEINESDEKTENKSEYEEEESEEELGRNESEKEEKWEEEKEEYDMGTQNKVKEFDLSEKKSKMFEEEERSEDNSEEKCKDSLSEEEWSVEEREMKENSDFLKQEHKDMGEERYNTSRASEDDGVEGLLEWNIEKTEFSLKKNSEDYESKPNSDEEISKQTCEQECFIKESTEENCDTDEENHFREDKNNEEDRRKCTVNDNEILSGPEIKSEYKKYCISESSEEDLIERWPVTHETGMEKIQRMMMDDDATDRWTAEQWTSVAKKKEERSKQERREKTFFHEINTVNPSIIKDQEGYHQKQQLWTSDDQAHDEDEQDSHVEKEISEDFHDGLGSPSASILTSGYGTYRPDLSKDGNPEEMDYRDDSTLAGLEEENDAQDYENVHGPMWVKANPFLKTSKSEVPPEFLERQAHIQIQRTDSGRDVSIQSEECKISDSQPNQIPAECDDISRRDEDIGTQNVYFDDIWEVAALQGNIDHPFNIRHRRSKSERRSKEKHYDDGHDNDRRKERRVKTYNGCIGAVTELEERLDHMEIGARRVPYDSESEEAGNYSDRSSSATDEAPSAFQEYIKGMKRSHSESDIQPRPKSFIRPVFEHPHTRNWKKSDPVARYFQYKQEWEMFKPPGEKSRKELHWAIRERLLYQPPPPRPQKTYIPNNYVVPTEKKRSALRWEIRHDLAHGIIPKKSPTPDREDVSLTPFTF